MEPLFEAKAIFDGQLTFYNIFRLDLETYKAEIVLGIDTTAPAEIILIKNNGTWQTESNTTTELGSILGSEIDVFNNGYGDMLGRIGVQ